MTESRSPLVPDILMGESPGGSHPTQLEVYYMQAG